MGTLSGFLSIAGAALTTIGAVTGEKDLLKVGGLMSLGGGIGTALGGASAGASAASGAGEVLSGGGALGTNVTPSLLDGAGVAFDAGGGLLETAAADAIAQTAAQTGSLMVDGAGSILGSASDALGSSSIWDRVKGAVSSQDAPTPGVVQSSVDPLSQRAAQAGLDQNSLQGYLKSGMDKAGSALGKTADFMSKNKELVNMGGSVLESMYGPEAEMIDWKKSIYNRQMRNLNRPVKLGILGGGG